MPSLRIDSSLKCKNCQEYYGNPQWQGYCSECHWKQMQRQRKQQLQQHQAEGSSATLPKPDRKPDRSKLSSNSSFSKFEEKRLRQSETLKKANLLKFSVFKKHSDDAERDTPEKRQEFKIPAQVYQGMEKEIKLKFPRLGLVIEKELKTFVSSLIVDVVKYSNSLNVDDLSERVQRYYQRFMKYMEKSEHFARVDADAREALMDLVEKHAMTYLHDLPSVVFSPAGTDDERKDRLMSERIQQLGWVCEQHLDCKLDRDCAEVRNLLYKAIGELLSMDSCPSPGAKVYRVVRCCAHVLAVCAARPPASADDLLPALIFTVLKANPPRLVSNINFVTRFCNAQRLMTGEGGYYFTNLCCAVSFIENMSAESLSMDKEEFDCYMAMPASIGGSSWAAALSLCAEQREAEEQNDKIKDLNEQFDQIESQANKLTSSTETFDKLISQKVQDVLARTPLEVKPRIVLPRYGQFTEEFVASLTTIEPKQQIERQISEEAIQEEMTSLVLQTEDINILGLQTEPEEPTQPVQPLLQADDDVLGLKLDQETQSPKSERNWDAKQTSMELLSPSPLGFHFDTRSIDELLTPEDFGSDLPPGLSNVNYDIDLSDFSGENSAADDLPQKSSPKDPFSPDGITKDSHFGGDPFDPIMEAFDEFKIVEKTEPDPFQVVPPKDPFSPLGLEKNPAQPDFAFTAIVPQPSTSQTQDLVSILDDNDSSTTAFLLPTPLQPESSHK